MRHTMTLAGWEVGCGHIWRMMGLAGINGVVRGHTPRVSQPGVRGRRTPPTLGGRYR